MDLALTVDRLRVYYFSQFGTIRAVDDVSFKVGKNEAIGIVGESGCGKSTLGTALLRSVPYPGKIIGGKVILGNLDVTKMSDQAFDNQIRWKKMSMIFQGALNSLDPVFTIGSQMKEILQQHGYSVNHYETIVDALNSVLLDPGVMKKYPHELSGGMKQRVSIAMALLLNPKILIADEPTTSLDVVVQSQIINLLNRLKSDKSMSIVFISHDLGVISEVSQIVAIMYRGEIVEMGKSSDIYRNPKHPYTEKLVSSIPSLKRDYQIKHIDEKSPNIQMQESGCKFRGSCPYAKEKCLNDPPEIRHNGGFVRCWLFE